MDNVMTDDPFNSPRNPEMTLEEWNRQIALDLIPADVLLGLYVVAGVLGNCLIVYIYQFRMKNKKIEDRFFIVALAVLDIFVCFTSSLVYLVFNILPVRFFASWTCKWAWFLTRTVSNTSGLLLVLIAIQRYLKVCRPFGWQLTLPRQKIALSALMGFSVLIDVPLFIFYGVTPITKHDLMGSRCGRLEMLSESMALGLNIYYIGMFATAIMTLMLLILIYLLIGRKIYKQIKKRQEMGRTPSLKKHVSENSKLRQYSFQAEGDEDSYAESKGETTITVTASKNVGETQIKMKRKRSKRKSALILYKYSLMFMAISAVTTLTYMPSLIVNLAVNIDSNWFWTEFGVGARLACVLVFQMYVFNHVCNPIIYGFFDTSFRKETKKFFCRQHESS